MIAIIAGTLVVLIILTIIGLLSRYRKCPSDEILVVFGKAGHKKDPETGKDIVLPSKIYHGGGTFVWPIIQDYKTMSLRPLQIQEYIYLQGYQGKLNLCQLKLILQLLL